MNIKIGIVIGHYNNLDALTLNITAIRYHCGPLPILISDDCSDGFCSTPMPDSHFGRLLAMQESLDDVLVWPNVDRIGHTGGDMSAFWKGIVWANGRGFDVLFKLSQRLVIDIPNWAQKSAAELVESGMSVCGGWCHAAPWLRTEAIGMVVKEWSNPSVLSHITPRRVNWPVEWLLQADIDERLGKRLLRWSIFSGHTRWDKSPGIVSYWTDTAEDYSRLAARLGVQLSGPMDCGMHFGTPGYHPG